MLHAFRLTVWFGFIAPIAALVAFAYVWDHPYLLWAVPLGLVVGIVLLLAIGILLSTWRDMGALKEQAEQNERGVDLYVRSRLLDMPIRQAPPPER